MNEATQKTFDVLKKVTSDSSSGLDGGLAFRQLWEPEEGENNFAGFAEMFDRSDLEDRYLTEIQKPEFRYFDAMQHHIQNDIIAPIHRDMSFRYSSRIRRLLEEAGRRKSIGESNNLLSLLEAGVNSFLASQEAS